MKSVVVGVDGSAATARALSWAAHTVGPSGRIHALTAVSPVTELVVDAGLADSVEYRNLLQRELETTWIAEIRGLVDSITTSTHEGTAWEALMEAADERRVDAIVVGAHLPPRAMPRTIGRTSRRLLRSLPCPLIVVPSRNHRHIDDGDPVIVGVGHGEATEAAVRWGARFAEMHDLPLGLIRATGEGPVFRIDGFLDLVTYYIDPAQRTRWASDDVALLAAEAQQATTETITVGGAAVPGLPASRLAEMSTRASLLVIGQHRSPFSPQSHVTQPLRSALVHAECPVAIIPA